MADGTNLPGLFGAPQTITGPKPYKMALARLSEELARVLGQGTVSAEAVTPEDTPRHQEPQEADGLPTCHNGRDVQREPRMSAATTAATTPSGGSPKGTATAAAPSAAGILLGRLAFTDASNRSERANFLFGSSCLQPLPEGGFHHRGMSSQVGSQASGSAGPWPGQSEGSRSWSSSFLTCLTRQGSDPSAAALRDRLPRWMF